MTIAGASYDQDARWELAEELDICDVGIMPHFYFFFRVSNCRVWDAVYSCYYDGPVSWQAEEVVSVALESHRKVLTHLSGRSQLDA